MRTQKVTTTKSNPDFGRLADFLFEAGILDALPRTGYAYLAAPRQSIADHTARTCYIAYALAKLESGADVARVVLMALFHDLDEARTSDITHLGQDYVSRDSKKAYAAAFQGLAFEHEVLGLVEEYDKRESLEAKIVKDADNLELILKLKELKDAGHKGSIDRWIKHAGSLLFTKNAQQLCAAILETKSDSWWIDHRQPKTKA